MKERIWEKTKKVVGCKSKKGPDRVVEHFGQRGNDQIDVTYIMVVKSTKSYVKELEEKETRSKAAR